MKQSRTYLFLAAFVVITTLTSYAQAPDYTAKSFSPAIMDNSFLIEEAYNQEPGVVQHIFNMMSFTNPQKDFNFSFTQEWPLFGQSHQISLTIPYLVLNSGTLKGLGDVLINYRYQLSSEDDWATVAPRLSLCLPSGNADDGMGSGVTGIQFNFPVSKRFSEKLVMHGNAGVTVLPNSKGFDTGLNEVRKNLVSYFGGMSVIWLAGSQYNVMLEFLFNDFSEIDKNGSVNRSSEVIINPGIRYAFDIDDLQIVPGLSVPLSISNSAPKKSLFLYLSFEHPF